MPRKIVPVILCGGAGSRLWPVSRQLLPKQFLPLVTGHTLLQDTALRAKDASSNATPIVICNEAHRFLVQDQLAEIGVTARIVLEPAGRSTAAAVAVAGMLVTFGIAATRPDSGFGYIERGEALEKNAFKVRRFVEKPAEKDARAMIATG